MRKKRSPIWRIDKNELRDIVNKSSAIAQILAHFNLENKGGNYKTLRNRLDFDNIDYSKFKTGLGSNKGRKFPNSIRVELKDILTINSSYNRVSLKKRLLKSGLLKEKCYQCGLGDIWNNKPITLQLDHINGNNKDNRLENLRIICPNCHSQTDTFAGKKLKNNRISYCDCGSQKSKFSTSCVVCQSYKLRKVLDRPTKEELEKEIWKFPTTKIAEIYNVSDKCIEKWCKKYNISKPPRGYWRKKETNKL